MALFEYNDYKEFVNNWIETQPKQGYGLYSRIGEHLQTSSVAISQIFKGSRDLGLEQAAKLAEFLALKPLETDYLLLLVQRARSGSVTLSRVLDRQLTEIRRRGQTVSSRIEHQQLTDEDKAIFYSSWIYLAVWLGASIPELSATEALAQRLGISERRVTEILRFLLERGLLVQKKGGHYELGQKVIHVPADSPFILKHHMNWRVRAFQSMDSNEADDLHYSAPMALSQKLVPKIREELLRFIREQTKKVADSPSETLMCLNIDWFGI